MVLYQSEARKLVHTA